MKKFLLLSLIAISIPALGEQHAGSGPSQSSPPTPTSSSGPRHTMIDLSAIDHATRPCDDFYQYACGDWLKTVKVPAGYPSWTRGFNTIDDDNLKTLHQILEGFANGKRDPAVPFAAKLGDYYAACMDESRAEKVTREELPKELAKIDAIQSKDDLFKALGTLQLNGVSAFFGFSSQQDGKDATKVIGSLDQGGLGLTDRDYYLKNDPDKVKIRNLYPAHLEKMLTLSGVAAADAKRQAQAILSLETVLARNQRTLEARRDPLSVYHPTDRTALKRLAPDLKWDEYFGASGTPAANDLNVAEPAYFTALNTILKDTSLADLKAYLRWQYLHAVAPNLGKAFVDENFRFFHQVFLGQKEQKPRWKRCVDDTGSALSEALGQAFVHAKFSPEARAGARDLLDTVLKALASDLSKVDWMDARTRKEAEHKLSVLARKIGYPEKFRDYSGLEVGRSSYLDNAIAASVFENRRQLAKIGRPLDRSEWGMPPQEVDAYYDPSMNEIVFPAAILQPPFFSGDATLASNYGAAGMVMGHENTHSFDDQGRHYDASGNLRDWWSPGNAELFKQKAACLVQQYDHYMVAGDTHVQGALTLGENIADLGGMKLALMAFQAARVHQPPSTPVTGVTEMQEFFLSFAQNWCTKITPELERNRAATDYHSPPKFRVNGVLANTPEFAEAFACHSGAPMAPANRCTIW